MGFFFYAKPTPSVMEVTDMKIIRSEEYYRQFWPIFESEKRKIDYHARQAERYKKLYTLTKGRKGVYGMLNSFAFKMNRMHCDVGMKIGKRQMVILLNEMTELDKISKGEEP